MLQTGEPSHKDQDFLKPVPSRALCGDIAAFADLAARVMDLDVAWELQVPTPADVLADARRRGWKVSPTTYLALPKLAPHPELSDRDRDLLFPYGLLRPSDGPRRTHLAAAAFRDLEGLTEEAVADRLSYSDERAARRAIGSGRRLLARLHAWPWGCWPNGKPPDDWWWCSDPTAADALGRWRRLAGWPRSPRHEAAELAEWRSGRLSGSNEPDASRAIGPLSGRSETIGFFDPHNMVQRADMCRALKGR